MAAGDAEPGDTPDNFHPLEAETRVLYEQGRWVVMLNVMSWEPDDDTHPIQNRWMRINDYSSEQEAQVAAKWIEKSANRKFRPPQGF